MGAAGGYVHSGIGGGGRFGGGGGSALVNTSLMTSFSPR